MARLLLEWNKLPEEILQNVLDILGWRRQVSLHFRLVCKEWRNSHDNNLPSLTINLNLQPKDPVLLAAIFPNLSELNLESEVKPEKSADPFYISSFFWGLTQRFHSHKPVIELNEVNLVALRSFPKLKHFRIHNVTIRAEISPNGCQELSKKPGLVSISLSGSQATFSTLKALTEVLTTSTLTDLNLFQCAGVDDIFFEMLSQNNALSSSLTMLDLGWCYSISDKGLASLTHLTGLKSLSLNTCLGLTESGIIQMCAALTSLTDLNLELEFGFENIALELLGGRQMDLELRRQTAIMPAIAGLVNLESLNLRGRCSIMVEDFSHLRSLTSLTSLSIAKCRFVPSEVGLRCLSTFSHLRTLDLDGCDSVHDEVLSYLCDMTSITSLSLQGCGMISNAGLNHLTGLTNLTHLNLARCGAITDFGLLSMMSLTALTHLDLSKCYHIIGHGLRAFSGRRFEKMTDFREEGVCDEGTTPSLTSLNLNDCKNVTDIGVKAIATISSLREVRLQGCLRISTQGFRMLGVLERLHTLDIDSRSEISEEVKQAFRHNPQVQAQIQKALDLKFRE